MAKILFIYSNPRHHVATFLPVIARLQQHRHSCIIASFAEFRGFQTNTAPFNALRVPVTQLASRHLRRTPSTGSQGGGVKKSSIRRYVRTMSWWLMLRHSFLRALRQHPDLVVLPNDAAFPYERMSLALHNLSIPFLLVQEGIRFPLPNEQDESSYGTGGAMAIAAWGESSYNFFRGRGISTERIHITGSPRFDELHRLTRNDGDKLREKWEIQGDILLLLTNPIDDQGFCSTEEKLSLVRNFLDRCTPLFERLPSCHLVIKLHARESETAYRTLVAQTPYRSRIIVNRDAPLHPLLIASQGAIIMASTVGLEALLLEVPLGVLEIPHYGFVHDYVESGVAMPLPIGGKVDATVESLLDRSNSITSNVRAYIDRTLSHRGSATQQVVLLIEKLL